MEVELKHLKSEKSGEHQLGIFKCHSVVANQKLSVYGFKRSLNSNFRFKFYPLFRGGGVDIFIVTSRVVYSAKVKSILLYYNILTSILDFESSEKMYCFCFFPTTFLPAAFCSNRKMTKSFICSILDPRLLFKRF